MLIRNLLGLGVALAAGGALLFGAPVQTGAPQPVALAAAWPAAQRGSVPSKLADGSEYTPGLFLDAKTSAGTVQSADTRQLRLVIRDGDGALTELRRVPAQHRTPFTALTAAGDTLVWVEGPQDKPQLWSADRRHPASARMLTADLGAIQFFDSQNDLIVEDGRVHWAASAAGNRTEFRSVPLAGGPVTVQRENGAWGLTGWPWAVDGHVAARGATTLRNLTTGQSIAVPTAARTVTACSPAWCRMVSINQDGWARIDLSHPDGSARRKVLDGNVATAITDVAVLDRFEVLAQVTAQSELSGNQQLLIYDLSNRHLVMVSPDAGNISYRAGVLWWSTGDQSSFVRNSLDLRTVG
ncbi:hypothetical protein ACWT_2823 [Actinoplanes sp. SE50]|uniref:hypothetical protein n=1 Tax=unclassified Actinoplanes TaxID=2626549 RepID=UPI00023EC5C8|nr:MULTISPECIES: hypothetical protein [unclassified Actinoplanes]AEV83618.1 hypothetical protein ACPL_2723 [Actinoplanes sp. SE50/110]ATO82238.1 hypothetical protein ACWT_2823 [Actinoplanes sp. SE50]SLL99645.1 uncharacterized protein ACSP50_2876 [Actinoplanes sp. SE50/110]